MKLREALALWLSPPKQKTEAEIEAEFFGNGSFSNQYAISFNGEKNLGEAGPIIKYNIDYAGLRLRSWQSLIESEVTQTIINKYCTWVIGSGLKLTSEPANYILEQENIKIDKIKFSQNVEQRFNLFRGSKISDYSNMENLDAIANTAFMNTIVGGDVLVVLRYDGKNVSVQLIDGAHVQSPIYGTEYYPAKLENGNELINGIEFDKSKKHIRYYVRNKDYSFTTIEAYGKNTGLLQAFLVKGVDYRLDNVRGLPLISAVLEKLKKMERYESATLGSAEERQKIVYQIVHTKNSTGETPLLKQLTTAQNYNENATDLPKDLAGVDLANKIAASTSKQTINMGIDSELKALESKNELYFKDFYTINIQAVCAAIGMPYQVAMSLYEGNFSASRAALKDWENTLNVVRKKFSNKFYQPIFNYWLEIQILENKVQAPGYLAALLKENSVVIDAYRKCRFTGAGVPHIDPLKEVNAIRAALGETAKDMPLMTLEEATETLYGSESVDNMEQFATELEKSKQLKIVSQQPVKKDKKKPSN